MLLKKINLDLVAKKLHLILIQPDDGSELLLDEIPLELSGDSFKVDLSPSFLDTWFENMPPEEINLVITKS